MENFENIVNRNHDKQTAKPKNEQRRNYIIRIVVSLLAIIATYAELFVGYVNIVHAVLVMLAAYTVGCFSLGRGIHLIFPKS